MISEMTIIVQRAMLKIQAERMRELASKISSRSYRLEIEQGEGAFVKELEAMAAELKSVGNALGALAAVTAVVVLVTYRISCDRFLKRDL